MVMEGVWMRSASPMVTDCGVGESEGVRQCMRFGKLIPFSGKSADSFIFSSVCFYALLKGFFGNARKRIGRIRRNHMAKEMLKLAAVERTEDFGTRGSRRLLRQGRIPCVIYGQEKPFSFTVSALEFNRLRGKLTKTSLIEIEIEGRDIVCFLKAVQEDLISDRIIHLDFYEIKRGKILTTKVSITLVGTAVGVREGGVLEQITHDAEIECLPKDLPDKIEVDISKLGVNENISISDIPAIEGVKFLDDPDTTVATIKYVRQDVPAAADEAAPAEGEQAAADKDAKK